MTQRRIIDLTPTRTDEPYVLEFDSNLYSFNEIFLFPSMEVIKIQDQSTYFPYVDMVKSWTRDHCRGVHDLWFVSENRRPKVLVAFYACEACEVGPGGRQDGERILIPPMLFKIHQGGFEKVSGFHPHVGDRGICQGDFTSVFTYSKPTFEWIITAISTVAAWRKVFNASDCLTKVDVIREKGSSRFDGWVRENIPVESLDGDIVPLSRILLKPRGFSRRWCGTCGGDVCWCRDRCPSCGRNRTTGDCTCCVRCHRQECRIDEICGMPSCSCMCCPYCGQNRWHGDCHRCDNCCPRCSICHTHLKSICDSCHAPICEAREHRCWVPLIEEVENGTVSGS